MLTTLRTLIVALALLCAAVVAAVCGTPDTGGPSDIDHGRAPGIKLAVMEFVNRDAVTPDETRYLTDCVRGTAARTLPTDRCLVMTRDNIQALLPEGQNLTDCSASDCEVETGRRVGADFIVSGEIIRFDGALRMTLKAYDCASGALLGGETAAGVNPSALEKGLAKGATALFARVGEAAGIPVQPTAQPAPAKVAAQPDATPAAENPTPPATTPASPVVAPVVVPSPARQAQPVANPDARVKVFITKSGTCYHREGCTSLRRSCIPMSLVEAATRYRPCSVCAPPRPSAGGSQAVPQETRREVRPATPRESAPAAGRCQATTKKGTQCSRAAKAGSRYCWQHGG